MSFSVNGFGAGYGMGVGSAGSPGGYTGGISFDTINNTVNSLVKSSEDNLNTLLTTISQKENPSSTDMLTLQQGLMNWTTMVQTSSTVTKDLLRRAERNRSESGLSPPASREKRGPSWGNA